MNGIVAFASRRQVLMVLTPLVVFVAGLFSVIELSTKANPDSLLPLVDIVTQSSGQSAEEIERSITIPIEIRMAGIPHITSVRTISLFGLSDVKVLFPRDVTYGQAEQWVTLRLSQLPPLPNGAQPRISPKLPIGEILRYQVVGPAGYSVTDLKTIEDWILERRFKAVPGVIDVGAGGSKTKTYDFDIDQNRLSASGISLQQVLQVLNDGNTNIGGQTVNFGERSATVRGIGLAGSMDDVRKTALTSTNGTPVLLGDVATVSLGHEPPLAIAGPDNGDDVVQGIVLMRRGEHSAPTIRRVEAELDHINASGILPPGVQVEKVYDRGGLFRVMTRTLLQNLIVGSALILGLYWLFLAGRRRAVIVAITIPVALAFAMTMNIAAQ